MGGSALVQERRRTRQLSGDSTVPPNHELSNEKGPTAEAGPRNALGSDCRRDQLQREWPQSAHSMHPSTWRTLAEPHWSHVTW